MNTFVINKCLRCDVALPIENIVYRNPTMLICCAFDVAAFVVPVGRIQSEIMPQSSCRLMWMDGIRCLIRGLLGPGRMTQSN